MGHTFPCACAEVTVLDDRDGDGAAELAFGCSAADVGGSRTGIVLIGSIRRHQVALAVAGSEAGSRFGSRLLRLAPAMLSGEYDLLVLGSEGLNLPETSGKPKPWNLDTLWALSAGHGRARRIGAARTYFEHYARSMALLGDQDGDGVGEIGLGSTATFDPLDRIEIVSGRTGEPLREVRGEHELGSALAACGDLDGDGVADFAVGQEGFAQPVEGERRRGSGRVLLYSGASGSLLRAIESSTDASWRGRDHLGQAIASIEDTTGDGVCELIIGGLDSYVRACSGRDGSDLWHGAGPMAHKGYLDGFAESLAVVGDANGDGCQDIAVGSFESMDFPGECSQVVLVSGKDGRALWKVDAKPTRVLAYPDYDRDGADDVLIVHLVPHELEVRSGRTGQLLAHWKPLESLSGAEIPLARVP